MTATNHALTGAAVATVLRQPILIIPAAFFSHFICDALPHFKMHHSVGDKIKWSYLYVEGLILLGVGVVLLILGVSQNVGWLMLAAFVAMSPDFAWFYYAKRGVVDDARKLDLFTRFHAKIQWSETKWGILPELAWAGWMISVILS